VSEAHDLSEALGNVRDQGPRGTCLAFAVTAVHEQARRQRRGASVEALGEESLYWACKQLDGDQDAGTYPRSATDALRDTGHSAAHLWPYQPDRDESAPAYRPPDAAMEPAGMRKARMRAISCDLDDLRARIRAGHAVVLGLELWPAFFDAPGGVVGIPAQLDLIGEGHAVAVVGFNDDGHELLLRNSWGTTWGKAGHGRLPYDALVVAARGAWAVDDDVDA